MRTWIALLRGINVLGRNRLPMKQLVDLLEAAGCSAVCTYIQSGNAVFRCPQRDAAALARAIRGEIKRQHGFEPQVLLLTVRDLKQAVAANPRDRAEAGSFGYGRANARVRLSGRAIERDPDRRLPPERGGPHSPGAPTMMGLCNHSAN